MSLTEYFRSPRVLTIQELRDFEHEIECIDTRIDALNESNSHDSCLWDHLAGRLEAIEMIVTHSQKLSRRKESCFQLIQGGAA